jgi:hypothetical protein
MASKHRTTPPVYSFGVDRRRSTWENVSWDIARHPDLHARSPVFEFHCLVHTYHRTIDPTEQWHIHSVLFIISYSPSFIPSLALLLYAY